VGKTSIGAPCGGGMQSIWQSSSIVRYRQQRPWYANKVSKLLGDFSPVIGSAHIDHR